MTTQNDAPDAFLTNYFKTGSVEKTAGEEAPVEAPAEGAITDADIEMVSALHLLEKNAAAQNLDLTEYEPEELVQAAHDLYINKEASAPEAEAAATDQPDAEMEEFFELHKFADRIQAHSFASETEKIAGARVDKAKEVGGKLIDRRKGAGKKLKDTEEGSAFAAAKRKAGKADDTNLNLKSGDVGAGVSKPDKGQAAGDLFKSMDTIKRNRRIGASIGAGGLATGTGVGAVAAGSDKKSSDSATERLIGEMQLEMLNEAGYVDDAGNIADPPGVEKSAADTVLTAIREEALSRLVEAGYK